MQKARDFGFAVVIIALVALWVEVAAAQTPLLVFRGGRVLDTPQVSAIYVGDYWSTSAGLADASSTDAFLGSWTVGPSVTDVLAQYDVQSVAFTGSTPVSGAAPVEFTDADAQALVQQELAAGNVTGGRQAVHVVYLPPGTVLTVQGNSSARKLGAYHSSYVDSSSGLRVYYAVVVYNEGTNGIDVTGDARQNISIMSSRALAGTFTNPDTTGVLGWFDDIHGEVGDVAFSISADLADVFTLQSGFAVVLLWSNKDGKLTAGSAGATTAATATGDGTLSITPATQEALPGTTITYTVANAASATDTLTISLSGLPETITGTLGTKSLAPGASTTLTLDVAADATTGVTTTFTITGLSAAFVSESVSATVSVVETLSEQTAPVVADFSFAVTPAAQDMIRGGPVATFVVATAPADAEAESPRLKVKVVGLQRGLKAYISRSKITAGDAVTVTIMAHRNARLREYAFSIKVASDRLDVLAPVTVTLQQP